MATATININIGEDKNISAELELADMVSKAMDVTEILNNVQGR